MKRDRSGQQFAQLLGAARIFLRLLQQARGPSARLQDFDERLGLPGHRKPVE
jgi:hypothetical protein